MENVSTVVRDATDARDWLDQALKDTKALNASGKAMAHPAKAMKAIDAAI